MSEKNVHEPTTTIRIPSSPEILSYDDDDYVHQNRPPRLPTIKRPRRLFFKKSNKPATITRPLDSDEEDFSMQDEKINHNLYPINITSSPTSENECDTLSIDHVDEDYYQGDQSLPVYKRGWKSGVPTKVILQDLFFSSKKRASNVPLSINSNVAFLVDLEKLGHPKDLLCDACGVWTQTNTKTKYYKVNDATGIENSFSEEYGSQGTIKVSRLSYLHSAARDFHRIVLYVHYYNERKELKSMAACQYFFEGPERTIQPKSHGSSKSEKVYHRTFESTKQMIKQNVGSHTGKQVVHDILENKGGISQIRAPGEHVGNRQQVDNFVYNSKNNSQGDVLLELMDMCKTQARDPSSAFVREIIASPELKVFLASNQQLLDIERFCSNPESFSVLGVDATYNIGDYYLTLTTYRNLLFSNGKGKPPVFIGPALIHQKKLFDPYFTLPSLMIEYIPSVQRVLVYGSDGEKNLCDSFDTCFCFATHLLCDIHMKDNIISKLADLGIKSPVSKLFIKDIFGEQIGTEKDPGLVDCYSHDRFDEKLESLRTTSEDRHQNGKKFYEYILTKKADYMKNCMTANVREMAGLGYPPKMYNQNANECANSVIKRDLNFKKLNIKEAALHLYQIVQRQFQECKLSMIGRGEWEVRDEYKDIKVPEEKYYRMTQTQKKKAEEKMFTCKTKDAGKILQTDDVSNEMLRRLAVLAEDSQIINFPFPIVEEMFRKASVLLADESNIVLTPGSNGKQRLVLSGTSHDTPHQVRTVGNNGQFSCDKNCIKWVTYKICAHTIAVAEAENQLRKFLNWYNSSVRKPNYTALANMDMPQGRGKKATKATQRRKGSRTERPEPVAFVSTVPRQDVSSDNACPTSIAKPTLPNPTPGSYLLTLLPFCHEKTTICYGCKGGLKPGGIPSPPNDFVVVTKGQRNFIRNDGTPSSKLGNMYFHFNEMCIKKFNSYYLSCLLKVPNDVKPHLTTVHTDYLRELNIPI